MGKREKNKSKRFLPTLAGSDKYGTRFELERVVPLLCRQVQVEGRVGCRSRGLREERGWCDGRGRGLQGGEVERVRVCKVRRGRLNRGGVVQHRRAELLLLRRRRRRR